MPEMDIDDLIERWRLVTAELDPGTAKPEWWQDEPVGHLLHAFRPDEARLPELFVGMPEMAPVLERLQIVFERAGVETGHLYFIVSRPRPMNRAEVERNTRKWLNTIGLMAQEIDLPFDEDVSQFLGATSARVEFVSELPRRGPTEAHPLESAIYETVTEFGAAMTLRSPAAMLLREPLYMLACSYELAYWVLSPLAPEAAGDPFAPFVALWEAGVSLGFAGEGRDMRALVCP